MSWYCDCDIELQRSLDNLREACAEVLEKADACNEAEESEFDTSRVIKVVSRVMEDLF